VLSKDDVEHIRKKSSKAPNSPAWQNYPGEMAKKCAIRRLCKTLPLTIEAQEAIEQDDHRNTVIDVETQPAIPGKSAAAAKLDKALGLSEREPETASPEESEIIDVESEENEKEF